MARYVIALLAGCLTFAGHAPADEPATANRDKTIVETLLRLKNIDVNAKPPLKQAVLRYLQTVQGTPRYLEIIERFEIQDNNQQLLHMLQQAPASTAGVQAARLLLQFEAQQLLQSGLQDKDDQLAIATIRALSIVSNNASTALLQPMVSDSHRSTAVRNAAIRGLGRNLNGQRFLLDMVQRDQIEQAFKFTVANALYSSPDATIRKEVAKHLTLPQTKGSTPLPPVAELVKRQGAAGTGQKVFNTIGTCNKCHKVAGQGKEVGPDLSEIGSKLSREAMFVAILDPNAGISHNYETYLVATDEGNVFTGIKVSETDETITIKTAEAIERTLAKEELEEIVKQKVSLMPADLQKNLTVDDLVNVVAYLLTLKKQPAASAN